MTKRLEEAVSRAESLPANEQDILAKLMQAEMDAVAGLGKIRVKPGGALGNLLQEVRREFKAGLEEPSPSDSQITKS
jgi:hypothetical protein